MFVVDSEASMHMLSKKDLSSDELDTLTRSRNPTTVMTANGEVQTKGGSVRSRSRSVRHGAATRRYASCFIARESIARITDIPMSGPMVKNPCLIGNGVPIQL